MNVLITGGSGLVGQTLTSILEEKGFEVAILSRSVKPGSKIRQFLWDVDKGQIDQAALSWADHIVHLAGETVGQRWTKATKERILSSRIKSTELLYEELRTGDYNIKSFVSASAIGYYGDTGESEVNEQSAIGEDYLADVVQQWENAVEKVKPYVENLAKLRIGIVLSAKGGALEKMVLPIRWGVGSPLGSGKQWMSWIDLEDLCQMFAFAIEQGLNRTYNAVAPYPVTNKVMTKAIARQLSRPVWLPNVPAFALKTILGEMSSIVLTGSKVSSLAIQKEGFKFEHETIESSLAHLL